MGDEILDLPEKSSQSAVAYDEVLRRLRSGQIRPGDKIVDKALAVELDMSRMPAREALLRLVNEGYLVGTTRGFTLPLLSVDDIMELFEIRKLLEPRAAASAAVVLEAEAIERLCAAFQAAREARAAGNATDLHRAHTSFRMVWLEAVPNRRLAATVSRFFDHVNAIRSLTLQDPSARDVSIALIKTILDGFQRRDALYVHDQMHVFIEASRQSFLALQDEYVRQFGVDAL